MTLVFLMCTGDFSLVPGMNIKRDLTSVEKELSASAGEFGFKIFKKITAQQPDSNIFISPLSISMALGMTYNGAEGETEEAMRNTLGFGDLTNDQINTNYFSLIHLLTNMDTKVNMNIANSIWIRQGFPVEEEFINQNKKYFQARVSNLDFSSMEAADTINDWVYQNTNGKIEKMVGSIDPLTVMYLINAIYFKAYWQKQFDPEQTTEDWFVKQNGDSSRCSLMQQQSSFQYLKTNQFQAVDLPYGDGDFSMTILMPNLEVNLNELISDISKDQWVDLMDQFHPADIMFMFPKFTLRYEIKLKEILKSLGMAVAFDCDKADFSDINPDYQLFISKVLHKSFIKVDEEGTEAAAATSVEISLTCLPLTVKFNRPFLFVIRERKSNTVIFIGKLTDPGE